MTETIPVIGTSDTKADEPDDPIGRLVNAAEVSLAVLAQPDAWVADGAVPGGRSRP